MRIIDTSNYVEPSDNGVLGMADATALLAAAESDDAPDAAAADAEPEDTEADEPEEGDDEAEDTADEQEEASDQEAGDEDAPDDEPASEDDAEDEDDAPETPASDPPKFWSAEEKALFAKAPPELQQVIAARDAEYSRQVSLAKEETATARKEASVITDVREAIDKQLERAQQIFQGKWDGVNWAQWAKDDVAEYAAAKEEFEAEREELAKLQTSQEATAAEEYRQFVKAEAQKLADPEHGVPALADPVKGSENKAAIVKMLRAEGFEAEDLKYIGAKELKIAWKAHQWDQAQARLAAKPPKPEPVKAEKKAPATVKPVAAAPPRKAIAQRRTQEVVGKAMKSGRMDDAVTALMAMERA